MDWSDSNAYTSRAIYARPRSCALGDWRTITHAPPDPFLLYFEICDTNFFSHKMPIEARYGHTLEAQYLRKL